MQQFLVGYGSLINPREREKIGLTRDVDLVRVHDYARKWNVQAINQKTYLGVVPFSSGVMNAVLIPVNDDQLHQLDDRERAYDRLEVKDVVRAVNESVDHDPCTKIWIYVPKVEWRSEIPTPRCAVKRRYVDTVMEGCLYYGDQFAAEFIATTTLWEQYWFENRTAPHALREKIDLLVGRFYPTATQVLTQLPSSPRSAD